MPKKRMVQVVIYMSQDMLNEIDREAEREAINRSEWIRNACVEYIEKTPPRERLEGIAKRD